MMIPTLRNQSVSRTVMNEYVLPQHTNALGNVFGGQVMAWVDICGAICAQRHCNRVAVTLFVDDLKFQQPVKLGEVMNLEAQVTATFRTSLEIEVVARGERPLTGESWSCVTARMTFVAIDDAGVPTPIPALELDTDAVCRSQADGEARREMRRAGPAKDARIP